MTEVIQIVSLIFTIVSIIVTILFSIRNNKK